MNWLLSSRSLDTEHIDDSTSSVSTFSEQLKEAIDDDARVDKRGCDTATKELSVLRAGIKLYEEQIAQAEKLAQAKDAAAANDDLRVQAEMRELKMAFKATKRALARSKRSKNKGKKEPVKKKEETGAVAANPARCGTRAGNLQCDKNKPNLGLSRNLYKSCPDTLERGFFIQVGRCNCALCGSQPHSLHCWLAALLTRGLTHVYCTMPALLTR